MPKHTITVDHLKKVIYEAIPDVIIIDDCGYLELTLPSCGVIIIIKYGWYTNKGINITEISLNRSYRPCALLLGAKWECITNLYSDDEIVSVLSEHVQKARGEYKNILRATVHLEQAKLCLENMEISSNKLLNMITDQYLYDTEDDDG